VACSEHASDSLYLTSVVVLLLVEVHVCTKCSAGLANLGSDVLCSVSFARTENKGNIGLFCKDLLAYTQYTL
jgi:hypothetical protein